ncbi:NUDIX domain-containing protein [Agrobacterium salinitolerans]|uniref:NUDIX domain-containing protein n=1 Tax=Agrobacterium salinitolerans TaxID=1183413 RepID=UPI0022B81A73|nr:NUDIX domain-containing protein [Agrobacterium salinitolerans]MCZ7853224.1 NUDIX domain-containing protein [Agrobacterium salinitolerans]MCZ7972987.1 NUDIX domain-containing protein [Agrobacterium salinitolerans]
MTQTQAKNLPAEIDAGRIRLVEKETVWKGFVHMQKLIFDQRMPDGRTMRIVREVHDHGSAAAILLYDPKRDSVVMVRQFRPAAFVNGDPSFMIEVPAGLLDDDDAADAIRREAMEESGYAVEKVEYLFDMYASPGTLTEKVSLFVARIDLDVQAGNGGGLEDEGEDLEVLTYGLDEAFGMIASGEITDSKTIILLQWAILNRGLLNKS